MTDTSRENGVPAAISNIPRLLVGHFHIKFAARHISPENSRMNEVTYYDDRFRVFNCLTLLGMGGLFSRPPPLTKTVNALNFAK